MKIKKYIIIDDKESDAQYLKEQLAKFPFLQLMAICPTLESTLAVLSTEPIDLVLLDIQLSDQSGLDLLKLGLNLPPVIIVSSFPQYALESYAIGKATDFLLKPFTFDRLMVALNRALTTQMGLNSFAETKYIFLKMGRKIQRFDFDSIDYIEAYGVYSKIHSEGSVHAVNERLASMSELLPTRLFIRVHKSYIINISKITSYDRHNLWIQKSKIPIGLSFRPRLEGLLRLFDNNDETHV